MSGPSRVLMVLHRAARAGTERHVLWLAAGLRGRGWKAEIAVSHGGALLRAFVDQGLPVHLVPRRGGADLSYVMRLARLARNLRIDVLHAHSGRVAALCGRIAGVAIVIETRHGLGAAGSADSSRSMRREAWVSRLAHKTVTVTAGDRLRLIAAGLPAGRVVCIPNGIPSRPEDRNGERGPRAGLEGRISLGFLGRLTPEKNPEFLIDLADRLEERIAGRWELAIAGEGPLRGALERGLGAHTARGAVMWMGETDGPRPLLSRVDMLLVPSVREGQPLAVLEAMQAGVVVIARQIPNLEETLGGMPAAGILLPGDPAAWAEAIAAQARRPADLAAYAREGAARVASRHSLARMIEAVDSLYRESFAARRSDC